jgi:hypothetical protein
MSVPPLDLYADLALSLNGENLKIQARDDQIIISFPSFGAAVDYVHGLQQDPVWSVNLRKLDMKLSNLYLTLYIQAGAVKFAFLGHKASATTLTFMLGIKNLRQGFF